MMDSTSIQFPRLLPGREGFHTRILNENDIPLVQTLMENCRDFFLLFSGLPAPEDEGKKLFSDLPPGKELAAKTVFGLFRNEDLIGVIDSIRGYPEEDCWFIGLFLLHPDWRGSGLGKSWLNAYREVANLNRAKTIRLGVVEQNEAGRRFWERNGFCLEARRPPVRYGKKDCIVLLMRSDLTSREES